MRLRADYFLSSRQGGAIDFKLMKESAFIFNKRAEKGGIIFLYTQDVSLFLAIILTCSKQGTIF
jgi:hypothetical protein